MPTAIILRYVLPSFGIALAIGLAVVAYRQHDQARNAGAWAMLASIGILLSSLVLLAGLLTTAPGIALFVAGAVIATVSAYRTRASQHGVPKA
jgi:hypothetical protein